MEDGIVIGFWVSVIPATSSINGVAGTKVGSVGAFMSFDPDMLAHRFSKTLSSLDLLNCH